MATIHATTLPGRSHQRASGVVPKGFSDMGDDGCRFDLVGALLPVSARLA
jgi:hypothetical protein